MSCLRWLIPRAIQPNFRRVFILLTAASVLFMLAVNFETILPGSPVEYAGEHGYLPSQLLRVLGELESGLLDRQTALEELRSLLGAEHQVEDQASWQSWDRCHLKHLQRVADLLPGFRTDLDHFMWVQNVTSLDIFEESPPFGFGEVEKEFQELVPQLQKFDPRWRKRFKNHVTEEREQDGAGEQNTERCLSKSCVVVGSSNKLLGSNLGSAIDAHDVVIRFNTAPTHPRYAADVGTKTSLRFFYPESAQLVAEQAQMIADISAKLKNLDLDPNTLDLHSLFGEYMFTVHRPPDIKWLLLASPGLDEQEISEEFKKLHFWSWYTPSPGQITPIWNGVHLMSPELLTETQAVANLLGKPTSGICAIVLALHECSLPVSIAGFSYSSNPLGPMHYYNWMLTWDMLNPFNSATHDVSVERKFIEKLIRFGLVKDLMQ